MNLQRLLSLARKAVDDYHMIQSGDRIAVGISGGKDSLTLLCALNGLKRFFPADFELIPICVDLGFSDKDPAAFGALRRFTADMGLELIVVESQIAEVVFDIRKESNPCSLCAKLRKGAFNTRAKELGCNKIAYAHHRNDFTETLLMSLIFEGRISCFSPVSYLDRMDLTLIRPLMYVEEPDIIGFARENELPVMKNPCPADGNTRREEMKKLLADLNKTYHGVSERMFGAIIRGDLKGWPPSGGAEAAAGGHSAASEGFSAAEPDV